MRLIAASLMLTAGASLVLGQGIVHNPGFVTFQNTETARPPGKPANFHLIYGDFFSGMPLVGTKWVAELYYMDTTTSSLTPMTVTLSHFKASTTTAPGTWNGPAAAVPLPAGYGGVDVFDDGSGEAGSGGPNDKRQRLVSCRIGGAGLGQELVRYL